ncbi:MAG TPA: AtpZ/AtpI family protein [Candidatus Acidoferrum sp.]|jgi:F0F1-type ATP synthase assembly protein I|nr:AtpZ/AtpI family protein [Candidatus Acidoferrum sp.]
MPDDSKDSEQLTQQQKDAREMTAQSGLAMELPITIVGAILLGGFLGYLLDRWLQTRPWLMIVGGAFGFASSIFEIVRRFRPR